MTFSRNSLQNSKFLRLQQRVQQIHSQRQRNEPGNCVFHISLSEPLASLDEHPGNYEEGHYQQAVNDIKHS
jgi:hypothetical protein